jgi:hypothetical protein
MRQGERLANEIGFTIRGLDITPILDNNWTPREPTDRECEDYFLKNHRPVTDEQCKRFKEIGKFDG